MATRVFNNSGEGIAIPARYGNGGMLSWGDSVVIQDPNGLDSVRNAFGGAAKTQGRLFFTTLPDGLPGAITQLATIFVSGERVATASQELIPHFLGIVPSSVIVSPTDLTAGGGTVGQYTVTEGTHDATNLKVTVSPAGRKYKVHAEP